MEMQTSFLMNLLCLIWGIDVINQQIIILSYKKWNKNKCDNIIVITKIDKATIFFAVLYFETQHNPCENIPTHSLSCYKIVVNNFY